MKTGKISVDIPVLFKPKDTDEAIQHGNFAFTYVKPCSSLPYGNTEKNKHFVPDNQVTTGIHLGVLIFDNKNIMKCILGDVLNIGIV